MHETDYKAQALEWTGNALAYIELALVDYPEDEVLMDAKEVLLDIQKNIEKQWPLPKDYVYPEHLGVYATRNLDDFLPDLAQMIYAIAGAVRRSRGEK